jgi:hypothetical protein
VSKVQRAKSTSRIAAIVAAEARRSPPLAAMTGSQITGTPG